MNDLPIPHASPAPVAPEATRASAVFSIHEFLAFKLGQEEYCLDILRVQEIRSFEPPPRMARKSLIALRFACEAWFEVARDWMIVTLQIAVVLR